MELEKHEQVMLECEEKADYFNRISFPIIAESFAKAHQSLKELIEAIKSMSNTTDKDSVSEE